MEIGAGMVVSFRYVMKDAEGNVLEDTTSSAPTRYLHGSDGILKQLQEQMEGLKQGEHRQISLPSDGKNLKTGYFFDVQVDQVRRASEKEQFLGYPLDEAPNDCPEDCICYN